MDGGDERHKRRSLIFEVLRRMKMTEMHWAELANSQTVTKCKHEILTRFFWGQFCFFHRPGLNLYFSVCQHVKLATSNQQAV